MEGSYEILGVIGRSGLGTLYRARYQGTGAFTKLVTLKRLDEGVADTDEVACRLRDEARMLGFLEHRAIVRVDNLVRLEGRWTLVLEHVDGVSLEDIIQQGPVPEGPALEIVSAVAGALHAAYTTAGPDGSPLRLQHRDVKPSGVLIDAYGAPRVTDFGIARACFAGREARTRSFVVGSFEYMSPERLALEEGGPWSDIYSLGQVFYALLMGHSFGRSHPSERHHKALIEKAMGKMLSRPGGVDEGVIDLLGRMLALEPHERPDARSVERSCHQLVRLLQDETLRGWAEQVVEPMLAARNASSQGGLVGRFLRESEGPPPSSPQPAVLDPSLVAERQPTPRPPLASASALGPAAGPPPTPSRDLQRKSARSELEPLPEFAFIRAEDEDDATEIMRRPSAGGDPLLDDEEQDSDATEMFSVVPRAGRPVAASAPPPPRPPFASIEELGESVTSVELADGDPDAIDLSVPYGDAPVFRAASSSVPGPGLEAADPSDEGPPWSDDPSGSWGDDPVEPSLDQERPTTVQQPDLDDEDELDLARPTIIHEPDEPPDEPYHDPDTVGRSTSISWFADEVRPELPQQGAGEVTAVTPPQARDDGFPAFSLPAGSLDEQTAIGPDLDTARAERSVMAQVRFDLPAAAQDDRTLESEDAMDLAPVRDAVPVVRFDLPAADLDEHTAIGEDIEAAREGRDAMPVVRFDLPARDLDEHTAIGEDIEAARDERHDLGAMPRVHFDAPVTAARSTPQAPLPPALDMPAGPPPPMAEPLPPVAPPSPYSPVAAQVAQLPPMPASASEPTPRSRPAPAAASSSSSASGPPPLPPPPPPLQSRGGTPLDERPTSSQARPWVPGADRSISHDRPQLDDWQPPSLGTIVPPPHQPPALSPVPMPPPATVAAVEVRVDDEAVVVEVQADLGPRPAPRPAAPPPKPSRGQDATVARGAGAVDTSPASARGAAPPAPTPRKGKLLIVLGGLAVLGMLGVALAVGLGAVWYFLLRV